MFRIFDKILHSSQTYRVFRVFNLQSHTVYKNQYKIQQFQFRIRARNVHNIPTRNSRSKNTFETTKLPTARTNILIQSLYGFYAEHGYFDLYQKPKVAKSRSAGSNKPQQQNIAVGTYRNPLLQILRDNVQLNLHFVEYLSNKTLAKEEDDGNLIQPGISTNEFMVVLIEEYLRILGAFGQLEYLVNQKCWIEGLKTLIHNTRQNTRLYLYFFECLKTNKIMMSDMTSVLMLVQDYEKSKSMSLEQKHSKDHTNIPSNHTSDYTLDKGFQLCKHLITTTILYNEYYLNVSISLYSRISGKMYTNLLKSICEDTVVFKVFEYFQNILSSFPENKLIRYEVLNIVSQILVGMMATNTDRDILLKSYECWKHAIDEHLGEPMLSIIDEFDSQVNQNFKRQDSTNTKLNLYRSTPLLSRGILDKASKNSKKNKPQSFFIKTLKIQTFYFTTNRKGRLVYNIGDRTSKLTAMVTTMLEKSNNWVLVAKYVFEIRKKASILTINHKRTFGEPKSTRNCLAVLASHLTTKHKSDYFEQMKGFINGFEPTILQHTDKNAIANVLSGDFQFEIYQEMLPRLLFCMHICDEIQDRNILNNMYAQLIRYFFEGKNELLTLFTANKMVQNVTHYLISLRLLKSTTALNYNQTLYFTLHVLSTLNNDKFKPALKNKPGYVEMFLRTTKLLSLNHNLPYLLNECLQGEKTDFPVIPNIAKHYLLFLFVSTNMPREYGLYTSLQMLKSMYLLESSPSEPSSSTPSPRLLEAATSFDLVRPFISILDFFNRIKRLDLVVFLYKRVIWYYLEHQIQPPSSLFNSFSAILLDCCKFNPKISSYQINAVFMYVYWFYHHIYYLSLNTFPALQKDRQLRGKYPITGANKFQLDEETFALDKNIHKSYLEALISRGLYFTAVHEALFNMPRNLGYTFAFENYVVIVNGLRRIKNKTSKQSLLLENFVMYCEKKYNFRI